MRSVLAYVSDDGDVIAHDPKKHRFRTYLEAVKVPPVSVALLEEPLSPIGPAFERKVYRLQEFASPFAETPGDMWSLALGCVERGEIR
jgi:hypothetical protein